MKGHRHNFDCVVVDAGRPRCSVTKKLIGDWWKKPLAIGNRQASCVHGLKIFLVDGSYVRNNLDSDFTQGNGFTFRFIPKNEIWLDRSLPKTEWEHFVLHECCQVQKIKKGVDHFSAYEQAKKIEEMARGKKSSKSA